MGHVMRFLSGLLLVTALAGQAAAQSLFTPSGEPETSPTAVVAAVPGEAVVDDVAVRFENGIQLLARLRAQAEQVISKMPKGDDTSVQREEMAREKFDELQRLADAVPGRQITLSFRIVDIVSRPAPVAPQPLGANASGVERERHAKRQQDYERAKAVFEKQPLLVVGQITLGNSAPDPKIAKEIAATTQRHREAVADINKRIADAKSDTSRKSLREEKAKLLKRHQEELKQLRQRQAGSVTQKNAAYVLGSNDELREWKRGQTRSVRGVVQKVAIFNKPRSGYNTGSTAARSNDVDVSATAKVFFKDIEKSVVAIEVIVHMLADQGEDAAAPAPQEDGAVVDEPASTTQPAPATQPQEP